MVEGGGEEVEALLAAVCDELGMEHAFIGRVHGGFREIRYAFGPALEPGTADPYEETYCALMLSGEIAGAVPDTSQVPVLRDIPVTRHLGISTHLGIPLMLADGSLYGSLCAYSRTPQPSIGEADVRLLRLVGRMLADRLEGEVRAERRLEKTLQAVEEALAGGEPSIVFQPIVELNGLRTVGFEALARFKGEPYRAPDVWISDATAAGLGIEVEIRAVENALAASVALPANLYMSVNASARVVMTGRLPEVLETATRPIVVEVTEHERAEGPVLRRGLAELRAAGHKVALDDGGAGYAGLSQVLELKPEVMKIDRNLVTGIDSDPVRQAMAAAATMFAAALGGSLVAEGVETEAEAGALRGLGVTFGQGFLFGRPLPAERWAEADAPRPKP